MMGTEFILKGKFTQIYNSNREYKYLNARDKTRYRVILVIIIIIYEQTYIVVPGKSQSH